MVPKGQAGTSETGSDTGPHDTHTGTADTEPRCVFGSILSNGVDAEWGSELLGTRLPQGTQCCTWTPRRPRQAHSQPLSVLVAAWKPPCMEVIRLPRASTFNLGHGF